MGIALSPPNALSLDVTTASNRRSSPAADTTATDRIFSRRWVIYVHIFLSGAGGGLLSCTVSRFNPSPLPDAKE